MKEMLILSPGPANISERVRQALTAPDIGHREEEFTSLLRETRSLLLDICGAPEGYSCATLSGSGTTGIEATITSLSASSGVLIFSNGVYGERAAQIAQVFGIPHTLEKLEWTQPLPLGRVEELVRTTPHDSVYLIHHETTTGILNPLRQVAEIAKSNHKWVLADTVSSVGGEELDLPGWGVDLVLGSANKCLRGVPGVSFVVLSNQLLEAWSQRRQVTFSTDLVSTMSKEEDGETPFTPPVQTMYALREAARELLEEGVENRIADYRGIATTLRDGLTSLELDFLVPREHLSNTMTTVMLPEGWSYPELHAPLKERGYAIYKSQGHLSQTTFRLGTVGLMSQEDIRGFLTALQQVLGR
jgi:2-aminoethylphosphonate-pyruvate transaminase